MEHSISQRAADCLIQFFFDATMRLYSGLHDSTTGPLGFIKIQEHQDVKFKNDELNSHGLDIVRQEGTAKCT